MPEVLLKIKDLKKSFGGVRAVDRCSFHVEKGRMTALIGPNGAGKTTVFNLISGFIKSEGGNIEFRGERIDRLAAHQRARRGIARTFQQVRLFQNLSLAANIQLAAETEDYSFWKSVILGTGHEGKERTKEALDAVGLESAPETLSSALSFGQQKLLETARALAFPHQLLMLDEPVAGVAPHLRERIAALLRTLKAAGETILAIEHDMDFVMRTADHVIVMDEGRVIAEGAPADIQRHPDVLDAYLGEQL
ncbi:hypothetical protein A3I42_00410 [Candidatus Uhrbacteria bacterium RIFCSPLOWO2_02_FULL_49_11]|uniref:ABC transporter domain-containing protein n=1 Tax=Candidatus Uhrbacteria bacterium RIFCSPLOWO2_02_FULL_49_11 TaxID=1802409 RepID=A0A1F7VBE0_9BACT|nr:MAG: hypothetical protein A3I42_00410 [Candidatus Uhrbacteria bacterium RIFCSPLOWO2_02_FULL_49_11]